MNIISRGFVCKITVYKKRMKKRTEKQIKKNEPIVCITNLCNQKCVFCSRGDFNPADTKIGIEKKINFFKNSICIEGGEPMLSRKVYKWAAYAKKKKVKDIILVTNGFNLEKPHIVKKLLDAGITMFNVHFPSHNEKLFDILTQTKGNFPSRVAAVKNLINIAGPHKVRLTMVVNSVIYKYMEDYAKFIVDNFSDILYIEINMIKVLGYVEERRWLVPRLKVVKSRLLKAFKILEKANMKFLTDGFPLCYLNGFEHKSIDVFKMGHSRDTLYLDEKNLAPSCFKCSLKKLCSGLRTDYSELYGYSELKPSRKNSVPIILKSRNQLRG